MSFVVHLMRHGVAEDPRLGQSDADRALTPEGIDKLQRAAPSWRRATGKVDRIVSSPLRRAQETARILAVALEHKEPVVVNPCLVPEADPELALELVHELRAAGCRSIALVGHEPHMGCLLGLLLTGSPRVALPFKKGMVAAVELPHAASLVGQLRWCLSTRAAADLR